MRRLIAVVLCALSLLLTVPVPARAQLWVGFDQQFISQVTQISTDNFYALNYAESGTTDFTLACLSGGLAVPCPAAGTLDVIGPVQSGGGTGIATIAISGGATCTFDGAITVDHYVQLSDTVAGNCTDAGATYPTNGKRVIGTTITTEGVAGNRPVLLFGRGVIGGAGNASTNTVVTSNVTHAQSSTTLTNVTGLSVAVCAAATEVWQFEVNLLLVAANTASDWKWGWTFPTGMTMQWGTTSATPGEDHWGNPGAGGSPIVARVQTDTLISGSAANTHVVSFKGFAFCSSTSGTLQLQFAQNTSDASDNTVLKGSNAIFRRMIP